MSSHNRKHHHRIRLTTIVTVMAAAKDNVSFLWRYLGIFSSRKPDRSRREPEPKESGTSVDVDYSPLQRPLMTPEESMLSRKEAQRLQTRRFHEGPNVSERLEGSRVPPNVSYPRGCLVGSLEGSEDVGFSASVRQRIFDNHREECPPGHRHRRGDSSLQVAIAATMNDQLSPQYSCNETSDASGWAIISRTSRSDPGSFLSSWTELEPDEGTTIPSCSSSSAGYLEPAGPEMDSSSSSSSFNPPAWRALHDNHDSQSYRPLFGRHVTESQIERW